MITKIAIVPYVECGRTLMGKDNHLNPLKHSRSSVLKKKIESAISENIQVIIDPNRGDFNYLKKEGVDCFIIPEYIKSYVEYGDSKEKCFFMTADEYDEGNIDRFMKYLNEK